MLNLNINIKVLHIIDSCATNQNTENRKSLKVAIHPEPGSGWLVAHGGGHAVLWGPSVHDLSLLMRRCRDLPMKICSFLC